MTRFRRAPDTAAVEHDDGTVYAARLPDGPILVLTGTAARVWRAVVDTGVDDLESARDGTNGADPEPFAEALVDAGLLIAQEDA